MSRIVVPAPARVHGDRLVAELAAAGLPDAEVTLVGDQLEVFAADATQTKVEQVVQAHVPPEPTLPPDPDADLAARIQAVHDDPQVSASVKKLTAALLGLNGDAAVAGRPTGAP